MEQLSGTVLYVEDNLSNLAFDTMPNLKLTSAVDAETGIDIARRQKPDVILMDINLPGMSGIDATKALKTFDETKNIPVIALTVANRAEDIKEGLDAGFYDYLTKPVQFDLLLPTLKRGLAHFK
ncbi:MAG: response regulator [Proteobacteria bacterium]|nr:response regulator [Pseudomonadota bacterium]